MTEIGVEAEFAFEEPSLKYHRFENDCPGSYVTTEIKTVAAHSKLVAIGCGDGSICIFDHLGNLIQNGKYKKHFSPINQLGISDDGDYIISCGDDGFVFIYMLTDPALSELVNLRRGIKSVAISPEYSRTKKFVTGDKKVTLHSQGAFGRRTSEDLYVPAGFVRTMKWRKNILIWSDHEVVFVYDLKMRRLITYIPKTPSDTELLDRQLSCCLDWYSDSCFIIGWETTVQIFHLSHPSNSALQADVGWSSAVSIDDNQSVFSFTTPTTYGSPVRSSISGVSMTSPKHSVRLGCRIDLPRGTGLIYGVTSHQNRILVLLYPTHSLESLIDVVGSMEDAVKERIPQILVLDVGDSLCGPASDVESILSAGYGAFVEVSLEDVGIKLPPNDGGCGLGLASLPGEDSLFIYSRCDVVYAQAASMDDRIDWYLQQDLPQRALQIAIEHQSDLERHTPKQLGALYLDKLIEETDFKGAAALCRNILTDAKAWENQIYRFLHLGQLHVLVPYLPASPNLISKSTYEVILIDLLSNSPQKFAKKLKEWLPSSGLYSLAPIISAVQERTSSCSYQDMYAVSRKDPDMLALWRALIILYEHADQPEKGLELLINLKDRGVFDLLRRQIPGSNGGRFGSVVRKHIIALCEIDTPKVVQLMIDYVQELPVDSIIQELESQPMLLYKYLDALHLRNPQAALPHAHRLVKLYAAYSRPQLLAFLRSTDRYPLNEALALCKSLNYVPETVYLLTRVGRRRDALRLLMEKGEEDALLCHQNLTPDQRKAEVAIQAIAFCEEVSSQNQIYSSFTEQHQRPKQRFRLLNPCEDTDEAEAEEEEEDTREDFSVSTDEQLSVREAAKLWNQVVLFAVDKPAFICALLKHASTERIDPSLLLRKIAPGMEIPGLKKSLVNLLHNTQMQIELRRSCQNILLGDSHDLFSRVVCAQGRGIPVDLGRAHSSVCRICRRRLLLHIAPGGDADAGAVTSGAVTSGIGDDGHDNSSVAAVAAMKQPALMVFRCSHTYHRECLSRFGKFVACPICVQETGAV